MKKKIGKTKVTEESSDSRVQSTEDRTKNFQAKNKTTNEGKEVKQPTFADLGVTGELCCSVERLGWLRPTAVQRKALPAALEGRDLIGLAETGSGKTGAFAIPILQHLHEHADPFCGLIVTPTRELALQIREQVAALGAYRDIRCACILGGGDFEAQALELHSAEPHVIVGTPGRLVDHMERSAELMANFKRVKFFILDEADRLLNSEFEIPIQRIVEALPEKRQTLLFSATMTKKVAKLQRAALVNPLQVSVSTKGATVAALDQRYLLVPRAKKDCAVVHLLRARLAASGSALLFTDTCREAQRLALLLRCLDLRALPLHGRMTQARRMAALAKFRAAEEACCLVATDVASRGLDIPTVEAVLNYSIPLTKKDYVHRVGRTARAGRRGLAVTLVTQYDVGSYQLLEQALGKKLEAMEVESKALEELMDCVHRAEIVVKKVMAETEKSAKKRRKRSHFDEDEEDDDDEDLRKEQQTNVKRKKKRKR